MKNTLVLLFSVLFTTIAYSQQISGTVTDSEGIPLLGVTIVVKGTQNGTTTDFDGKYIIDAKQSDVLKFSYIGMLPKEITVEATSVINVTLEEDASLLDEVVVTAFGVEKKEKSLGYSVTQVKSEDLNLSGQANALEALQGRVAGVQINRTSGSSGGGVDILIRGVTSVNPDRSNQPLIIVDGIALNNDTFSGNVSPSAGSNSPSSSEQFSFSNRAGDINPEDIESYNVLKGAAATALYGVRAANGAIVITTKKGKKGKAKINFTASTTFRNLEKTPNLQETYREGFSGAPRTLYDPDSDTGFNRVQNATSFYSWGPKYTEDSYTLESGEIVDLSNDQFYSPYDLFKTGVNTQVNLNISGATDKMDYFFSVGNNSEEGILPGTYYDKTNFRLKSGYQVTDNFSINTSISYSKSGGNRGNSGDKSVMSSLSYYSGTFPINDYQNPDGTQRNYTFGIIDNPRYFIEKSSLYDDVNRWVGNAIFKYSPKDWLNITYSAQVDNYSDQRNRFVPADLDVGTQVGGFIVNQNINFTALESNFLVAMNKDWSDDFRTDLTLGHQVSDTKRDYADVRGETLNVPGINELGNTINTFANESVTQLRNVGVFGELKLSYLDKLFLTVTGRNDWVSTLPKDNRSFFYPSVSLAYDISDVFGDNDVFTFGKLRASWAEVGKGPLFGQVGHYFVVDGDFPFGGAGGYRSSTALGDLDIVPERNQSTEIGADLRFLKNRIRLDYAYYKTRVKDQIFGVGTAYSSGISRIVRNAGDFEVFGHEFLLSADIIKSKDFNWEVVLNWSTSEGKVLDIPDDIESIIFADSGFAGVTSEIREGDKMGSLYGWKWRYENGERYIDANGKPEIDFTERQKVGNAFPDYITSLANSFKWKNLGFNFLLEYKKGGDIYDAGRRNSIRNGILEVTEFRDETTVLSGVMDDGNGGFIPNTTEVLIDQNYYRSSTDYNRASEILVQDASWVKLRNIGVTYDLPLKFIEKIHLDRFSVTASAQNILVWTPYDGYDPEGNQYSAGSNVYGFTGLNIPLSQSYSFGINVGF
ncbi:SusC/RagA family TonB-linked outer membrane protein [Cellulophaga lytica]|uniref:TonB-dependent receptor plug n=1 Tax=Cellulophaga lytica (strain ATCC 23178 / DSM 7489 / JCM 8516 / NBRC 14961 / NCIMB 1423 / VKM B-1433 / Cy l20) TaxID=867900 RepID=F0RI33_CELLC|nr:SusC/RagA family TonB-linked outer membrane protein [Cellulophaga lytica]ADY30314.1 TonB-dependent receptor plug [Cellulophaga lytica DSM 7489]AIM61303.1 TonB-dependent receptor [Cellulophaga lytica]WQG78752.1 SusC/RagA family TonB-linked outer membrane protein [Cellulophaga lytica]